MAETVSAAKKMAKEAWVITINKEKFACVTGGSAVGGTMGGALVYINGGYQASRNKVYGDQITRHARRTTLKGAAGFGLFIAGGAYMLLATV